MMAIRIVRKLPREVEFPCLKCRVQLAASADDMHSNLIENGLHLAVFVCPQCHEPIHVQYELFTAP